jgi:hypothetical protein
MEKKWRRADTSQKTLLQIKANVKTSSTQIAVSRRSGGRWVLVERVIAARVVPGPKWTLCEAAGASSRPLESPSRDMVEWVRVGGSEG